ncbi:acyl-CoA dehydrogenase family protein [Allorhizocola rhizosphaerae]|uniref:acyl-CoA dehydrogenase family protein n=1 Tax=Allorhizocola rhizosphaerae TaxID=1872709 RepID=UPI000E3C7E22|nr:acyl-CoA dehydrogenase family protein [Allorhizocola rhizosphaerae]
MSGLITEMWAGRLRWDLLQPFPQPPAAAPLDAVGKLLAHVDPDALDETGVLPAVFLDELRRSDLLRLQLAPADGGSGLSDWDTLQAMVAAMRVCPVAGFILATHNGIGLPALLPTLPPGALRDLVVARLRGGAVSGWADTEPSGAANTLPSTTATPVEGGWELNGRKIYISNGAIADELIVSALLPEGLAGLFVVETTSAGFTVETTLELIGFHGMPLGSLRFDGVRVPALRHVPQEATWREAPLLEPVSARGRTYLVAAASLALAEQALQMQREVAKRRIVDGRPLVGYRAVSDLIARSVADTAAIRAVVEWCMLGDDAANLTDRFLDRKAAKNATSLACWRVLDRTMSLFAAEGLETPRSKRRRGAPAWPVERLLRDGRILRVTGGVDFALDVWAAETALATVADTKPRGLVGNADALTARNREHLRAAAAHADRLAMALRFVSNVEDQHRLGALGRIMGELFTMAVTLAGAPPDAADVYCVEARQRLAGLWSAVVAPDQPAYARLAADLCTGDHPGV